MRIEVQQGSIALTLKKAKLAGWIVTIFTDDGEDVTGKIEALEYDSVKVRQDNGVVYVPVREIEDIKCHLTLKIASDYITEAMPH